MCGDDLEAQLHEVDSDYAHAHSRSDFVKDPRSHLTFHPGVTLGVGNYFGKVSSFHGFWIMQKTVKGYSKVNMRGARGLLPTHWPEEYVNQAKNIILKDQAIQLIE